MSVDASESCSVGATRLATAVAKYPVTLNDVNGTVNNKYAKNT